MWREIFTKKKEKKNKRPLRAYRIQAASRERAEQIASGLKQSGVRVSEEFPSHVLCYSSAEFDSLMNVLLLMGIHRDDVTRDERLQTG
jgi:isopentenyl phosphate kinase